MLWYSGEHYKAIMALLFKNYFFKKIFQEYQQCQTVWTQIGPDIFWIWVQTVCIGYQQTAKVATSRERVVFVIITLSVDLLGQSNLRWPKPLYGQSQQTNNWWYFFSILVRKHAFTFHANCLIRKQFAWNDKACFLGKIENKNMFQYCLLKILPSIWFLHVTVR